MSPMLRRMKKQRKRMIWKNQSQTHNMMNEHFMCELGSDYDMDDSRMYDIEYVTLVNYSE